MVDLDTVRAVVNSRMQVMAQYARQVVKRVHADEVRLAEGGYRDLLKKARRLLIKQDARLSSESKQRLKEILAANNSLCTVYEFRLKLQELWEQRTASQEILLQALQDWCHQAEETGIRSLQEFAAYLRSYALVGEGAVQPA